MSGWGCRSPFGAHRHLSENFVALMERESTTSTCSQHEDQAPSSDSENKALLAGNVLIADVSGVEKDEKVSTAVLSAEAGQQNDTPVTLKREITPVSGVLVVVNQFIGSGIFITQSAILCNTGSFGLSLVCWLFGGLVALAGAMCYLELGLLVRKTGGEYAILLEAYSFHKKNRWVEMLGSLVSFLYTWTNVFLLRGVAVSIITLTCASYLTRPFFIGCALPLTAVKLIALAILCT